ncbi:unannotated protein [freshwater metagenome]|uniref:Unannotated protein n=1 Tax=freshwater metagenome TaxID=449393 RepID=A0A6J6D5Y6_9ZZZZ
MVTSATNGLETPYPIQPPPCRIAVAPVPVEPLSRCKSAVVLITNSNVPIVMRPVSFDSSGALNNR